jgi:hypothetical protein
MPHFTCPVCCPSSPLPPLFPLRYSTDEFQAKQDEARELLNVKK